MHMDELMQQKIWFCWNFETRNGKRTKVPISACGTPTGTNAPYANTWVTFLTPIKRNDKRIANNNMLEFQGVLNGIANNIRYCNRQIQGGNFLYAFRDVDLAAKEENSRLNLARKKNDYDEEIFAKKEKTFGLIVLESDLDIEPLIAYKTYSDR